MRHNHDSPKGIIKPGDLPEKPQIGEVELPTLSKSFRDVYGSLGRLPFLVFILVAVAIAFLFVQQLITSLIYPFAILVAAAVFFIFVLNWIAYRKWRFETEISVKNHHVEMERYQTLFQWEKEKQDKFILNVLEYFNSLPKSESNPNQEPGSKSITLAKGAGDFVKRMIKMRMQLGFNDFALPPHHSNRKLEQKE